MLLWMDKHLILRPCLGKLIFRGRSFLVYTKAFTEILYNSVVV